MHFSELGCHLRIAHSLLAVEVIDHLDGCSHIGCQLKDADALGNAHRGVCMPQRVGHPSFPVRSEQDACLLQKPVEANLEAADWRTLPAAEEMFGSRWITTQFRATKCLQFTQKLIHPDIADDLPFTGLAAYREDRSDVIRQGPSARNIAPSDASCLTNPDAGVCQDQNIQNEVIPLALSSLVLGHFKVVRQVGTEPSPLGLRNVRSGVVFRGSNAEFWDLADVSLLLGKPKQLPKCSSLVLEGRNGRTAGLAESPLDIIAQPIFGDLIDAIILKETKCPQLDPADIPVNVSVMSALVLAGDGSLPTLEHFRERR